MRTWIISFGLLAALLAGCAAVGERSRETAFNDIARLYAKTLGWSDFDSLPAFARFSTQHPAPGSQRYRYIQVTDYRPEAGAATADGRTVVRRAQIDYLESRRMRARTLAVEEVWSWSEADGRWYLLSGWPLF